MTTLTALQGQISSERWAEMRKQFVRASKAQVEREMAIETARIESNNQGAVRTFDVSSFSETPQGDVVMLTRSTVQIEGHYYTSVTGTKISQARGCVVLLLVGQEDATPISTQQVQEWLTQTTVR